MTEPKNGDFTSYLNQIANSAQAANTASQIEQTKPQIDQIEGVLNISAETLADEDKLEELAQQMMQQAAELEAARPMSDEELERQALEAGGADDDPKTPE